MALYLVRHARAGDRRTWSDDDRLRPLSGKGHTQALMLAEQFTDVNVPCVLSSPYARCVQTVDPIAAMKGLEVETTEVLAEGWTFVDVIELLARVAQDTVLCSHGDVIPETIGALYRRGMEITTRQDWRKGSTWVIERNGDDFISAAVLAPPGRN